MRLKRGFVSVVCFVVMLYDSQHTILSCRSLVNAIFTGANTVYEPEIHTHLNVIAIAYTAAYDVATGSGNALDIMRANFGKSSYTEPFHYEGADLHHALLGKGLGGGIAYVGALCRSDIGFGLSASLTGSYTSMNEATVWDMKVFTVRLLV